MTPQDRKFVLPEGPSRSGQRPGTELAGLKRRSVMIESIVGLAGRLWLVVRPRVGVVGEAVEGALVGAVGGAQRRWCRGSGR